MGILNFFLGSFVALCVALLTLKIATGATNMHVEPQDLSGQVRRLFSVTLTHPHTPHFHPLLLLLYNFSGP
jgi:hypothetical protein